jgi:GNAT acetyltransferase-like protein
MTMYTPLGTTTLKNGERMEIGVAAGPDPEWLPRIVPFLGHKPGDYRAHIRRALQEPLDDLRTRFYVGTVEDRIAGQIMVVGSRGVGIVAHVFTDPEDRRKGVCGHIMGHQMGNCRREGFRVLSLGTGFESPPYWIYHSFGFRSVAPGSGCMKWSVEPEAEAELFLHAPVRVRDLQWDDWGFLNLLALQPAAADEELPRCPAMGLKRQGSLEGPFVTFQVRREREPMIQARALVTEGGATVGWALLAPDPHWFRDTWILDLHTHPNFTHRLADLLAALTLPDAPVAAYLTEPRGAKTAALSQAGFRPVTSLPAWINSEDRRLDLTIWLNR